MRMSSPPTSTSCRVPRPTGGSSARLRRYDYDNQTPQTAITQFINYDTSVTTSSTGGPELFAHSRTTFDTDATWTGLLPLALTAGYTHNSGGYDFRIFESTGEDVLTLKADTVAWQWATIARIISSPTAAARASMSTC